MKALATTQTQIGLITDADVLVACPECVAWSTEGKRQGLKSLRAQRQCITFIEIMRKAKPKMMILENVRRFPLTWFCSRVEARLPGIYRYSWRIYNARLYGVPQRRIRLYLVLQRVDAVLQSMEAKQFAWPCTMSRAMTLSKYKKCYRAYDGRKYFCRRRLSGVYYGRDAVLGSERKQLKAVLKQAKKKGENIAKLIVDLKTNRSCNYGVDVIPTITARGASLLSFYHCGLQRRLCVEELAMAQGFELQHCAFEGLGQCSRGRLVGNAMISPLISDIIKSGLKQLRLRA